MNKEEMQLALTLIDKRINLITEEVIRHNKAMTELLNLNKIGEEVPTLERILQQHTEKEQLYRELRERKSGKEEDDDLPLRKEGGHLS